MVTVAWDSLMPHAALLLVSFIFGGMNILLELSLGSSGDESDEEQSVRAKVAHSAMFTLYRDVGAAIVLALAVAVSRRKRNWRGASWSRIRLTALCGALAIGGQVLFIVGLSLTSATESALFMPLFPVVTMLLGVAMRQETCSVPNTVATVLAVVGMVAAVDYESLTFSSGLGLGLLLVNVFTNALATVVLRLLSTDSYYRDSSIELAATFYFFGALTVAIVTAVGFLLAPDTAQPQAFSLGVGGVATLLYTVLLASSLNYALITWASARVEPSILAIYGASQTVTTSLLSFLVLSMPPSLRQLISSGFMAAALLVCCLAALHGEHINRHPAACKSDALLSSVTPYTSMTSRSSRQSRGHGAIDAKINA